MRRGRTLLLACVVLVPGVAASWASNLQPTLAPGESHVLRAGIHTLRLQTYGDQVIRITRAPTGDLPELASLAVVAQPSKTSLTIK